MRVLAWLALWLACLWPGAAAAQPGAPTPQDRILAQALFEDAVRLMDQGAHEEACPKFEQSSKLDPGVGVSFRLADCYELTGRLAAAWILFVDVAAAAKAEGQLDRASAARRRADALDPRLIKLTIDVREPISEMVVTHNGVPVSRAQWGTAVPVEPGAHVIEAKAPGYRPFRKVVQAEGEGSRIALAVPQLEEIPAPPPAIVDKPKPPPEPPLLQYGFAIGMGVTGVLGLGVGAVAGIVAIEKKSDADAFCPEEDACFAEGLQLREEAKDAAAVSTVAFIVGVAALAGGLVLWLTADLGDDPAPIHSRAVRSAAPRAPSAGLVPMWVPDAQGGTPGLGVVGRF